MIGYTTLGTNDIDRALGFYDALFAVVGAARIMQMPDDRKLTLYGSGPNRPMLGVGKPYDGGQASVGNGVMVALAADSREQVDALHAKAIELGGSDEGAPGVRPPEEFNFYGAYFRDPDGNKFCAYKMG
ncbi:VOC family protein [uncultured Sphingomonas sp.]|uniref:VOC family protein n=1 Tax=uncultured Sphingomonas sp. TaxID=158754 RepID=UPI0035CADD47